MLIQIIKKDISPIDKNLLQTQFILNSIEDSDLRRVEVKGENFGGITKLVLKDLETEQEIEFEKIDSPTNLSDKKYFVNPEYPDKELIFIVPKNCEPGNYDILITNDAGNTNRSSGQQPARPDP